MDKMLSFFKKSYSFFSKRQIKTWNYFRKEVQPPKDTRLGTRCSACPAILQATDILLQVCIQQTDAY